MTTRTKKISLWILQGLLAALFLFAGASKLALPADELAKQATLPIGFLRFIGACEVLGALGLVLPAALRIKPWLTPLAAAGLVIIMIGAVIATIAAGMGAAAAFPAAVGVLCAVVVRARAPRRAAAARIALAA